MRVRGLRQAACLLLLVFMSASPAFSVSHAGQAASESLFSRYYRFLEYSGRKSPVIGQILRDDKLGRLDDNRVGVQLTLVRLYIAMGLHFQAGQILQSLVAEELPDGVHDEVWFYLGKSYFHLGYLDQAEQALARVRAANPSAQIRAEKLHLLALIKMQRGEFLQAASLLQKNWWRAPGNWDLYARFNLAVALIQSDRLQEGMNLLKQTSFLPAEDDEARALIDKVNQAMGYLLLQQEKPEQARAYLEKVRLRGPYSNMALLGAGWASAVSKEYKQALVPWLELHGRDRRETSVLEVMLSVPYAYEQLQAWGQAAEFYQKAIAVYQGELVMLEQTITAIRDDRMGAVLRDVEVTGEQDWMRNMQVIEGRPATRYIKQFMDDESFFNIMNNYREARAILEDVRDKTAKLDMLQNPGGPQGEQQAQIAVYAADLGTRAEQLVNDVRGEIVVQEDKLKQRALRLLEQRKARLDVNLVQARLALAQTYQRLEASSP